jgi:hypothetical protein
MAGENINRRLNIYINDREVINSMRGVTSEMGRVRNQMRNLNAGAADYNERLQELRNTYSRLIQEQARLRADLAQTPGIFQRIRSALGPVAAGMLAAFSVTALVSGFVSKMKEAFSIIVEFDQKQADLAAIMQKSRLQIAGLTMDAIKYGASTSYSAGEVSILQTELARLGKTAPEIRAMTKDVLNAATALETDLGSAATLIGGQLNSYGEAANQAGKYSDIMANSANISATSFESMAVALPKVSKVAALNNISFERLNATLGTLADENIAAETSGTGFRNILLESAKVGKPYQEMLDMVKNSTNQGRKATELFGKENAIVAVVLANSTQKINDQTKALENSAGSSEKLAKEKMNSILGATKNFSSAWEGLILSIEKGDGVIGRTIKNVIDFGSSFLGLISPMKKVSDQLHDEQLGLNMLVSKITSTNTKNEERKQLLIQLNNEYPDFIKNIDIEKVSNDELNGALNKVNEQYINRIALQKQVEKVESKQNDVGFDLSRKLEIQERLFKRLNDIKGAKGLKVNIDYGNLEKSGNAIIEELTKKGSWQGVFSDTAAIKSDLEVLKSFDFVLKMQNKSLEEQTEILNRQKKALGMNTEAENEKIKALAEEAEAMKKIREEAKSLGMKNVDKSTDQQVKIWIANYKEMQMLKYEESEEDRKKREKAIEDAKKHSADLLKELDKSKKELLAAERSYQDSSLNNQKENYEKELKLLNIEYDRKIEDSKIKGAELKAEINKLNQDIKDPKNSKSDVAVIKDSIAQKIATQKQYTNMLVTLEETRNIKIGVLQEKYLNKSFQKQQDKAAREIQNLRTKQAFELAEITSFEQAKGILSKTLSSIALSKITTFEQAKKAIKKQYLQEQYDLELKNLNDLVTMYESALRSDFTSGFVVLSDEEKDKVTKFLDDAKAKIAEITGTKSDAETTTNEADKATGIDLLGFDAGKWESVFANLDTFESKIAAIQMVAGALTNAFSTYFKFLEAGEARTLQKFQKSADSKKKALQDQLDKGTISQEVYNSRVAKIDADLARKKAEIEYKQAKRQKAMAIVNAIVNTAVGIMQAYSQLGPIGGTVAAVLIGAMGALEVATIAKQPLPDKNGFKKGGYTGNGSTSGVAGDVHFGEYVVPNEVLSSNDPVVPYIVGYIEQKRSGKQPSGTENTSQSPPASQSTTNVSAIDNSIAKALDRNSEILEKIEENGIPAYLVNDIQAAKKIRNKIKELTKLETNAKV